MIRITYLLRRAPGMSLAEFQQHWRDEHGPRVARLAPDLNALRYVQGHTLDDATNAAMAKVRGGMEPPYDGVAEMWFEDREVLEQSLSSGSGRRAFAELIEDEAKFIDLAHSPLWLNHELPQVNPASDAVVAGEDSSLVKLYFAVRSLPQQSDAQAQRYWYSNHGPLIRYQAALTGIKRYIQVHRVEDDLEAALRSARGTQVPPYMGHAEIWFDQVEAQSSSPERRAANRRAIEDEKKFIDFRRSSIWLAKERVIVDRRPAWVCAERQNV